MTLKDQLYTVTETDGDRMTCDISLIADSAIYRAHFPGQPVTPGVCIIQIAAELLELLLGCTLRLHTVVNAKYLAVIDPLTTPALRCTFSRLSDDGRTVRVSATFSDSAATYTKLSLSFLR